MKKIFEEYVESSDYKIIVFFKELKSQIEKWFTNGSLAAQGCTLDGDISISNYNPMEKFLIFNFVENITESEKLEDDDIEYYRYRVIFMVKIDQMNGDDIQNNSGENNSNSPEINKVSLKIHQFDDDNNEKSELVEEIDITDIKEDFLIDKIGQLKDKSDEQDTDQSDFKDEIYIKQ